MGDRPGEVLKLKEPEERPYGVYLADSNAKTIGVDRIFEKITATMGDEVIGRLTPDLVKNGYIDKTVTLQVLKSRRPVTIEQRWLKTKRKVIVTGNPIFNDQGKIVMVTTTFYPPDTPLGTENVAVEGQLPRGPLEALEGVVSASPEMNSVLMKAAQVAALDVTVLLEGETGVGKEVLARFIHQNSARRHKPFIKVNLGALPGELFESELFGYRGGSFTGALKSGKKGLVQAAAGGTLFLDEISETPYNMQVKLLGLLQEKEMTPIGDVESEKVDVRFVTATNRDLRKMVREGQFREDLFYRVNVLPIYIPPLRERREDIFALTQHFLAGYQQQYRTTKQIDAAALNQLCDYNWPGNVRELKNIIERLVILSPEKQITKEMVLHELGGERKAKQKPFNKNYDGDYRAALARFEQDYLLDTVKNYGSFTEAAQALGMHRTTLARKLRKYGIIID